MVSREGEREKEERAREVEHNANIPTVALPPHSVDLCSFPCNEIRNDPRLARFLSEAGRTVATSGAQPSPFGYISILHYH